MRVGISGIRHGTGNVLTGRDDVDRADVGPEKLVKAKAKVSGVAKKATAFQKLKKE